jgi:hypothetical protein
MPRITVHGLAGLLASLSTVLVLAQGTNVFRISRDHPAIQYSTRASRDSIVKLNERIERGEIKLTLEPPPLGYLKAILAALDIPLSSQTLVFSENSLQRAHISKATPRAIYFGDTVAVSWVNGAETVEATALDATQGVHFYSIPQQRYQKPQFVRRTDCLECHLMPQTSNVPGLFAMSVLPLSDNKNDYAQGWATDHRTPVEDRWGGWYVTGTQVPSRHLGNVPVMHVPQSYVRADAAPKLTSGAAAFDTAPYPTPYSDVVALLVQNHQLHMTNLLTRLGWEARIAAHDGARSGGPRIAETVGEFVDYMLFVDEAPLPSPVRGSSPFAQEFSSKGPRDARGRSLREFDLSRRLFRYPCSYMIYTEAFDALPASAKTLVYERLWAVLSGKVTDAAYGGLSRADRRAIVEILRETKTGLPEYFRAVTH